MIFNKNVLHVITTINRGGAENHLIELVRGQRSHGWKVGVAYLKGDGYWADTLSMLDVDVYPLELVRYGELRPLLRLLKLIRDLRPNIVHAHMPPAEIYVRLALLGVPMRPAFVISKHNDEPFYRGFGWRFIGRWVASRACHLIAISDAVNRYMRINLKLMEVATSTVYYGVDPAPFRDVSGEVVAELRMRWGAVEDVWIIGTVARLVPQKALHILIEGYAIYRRVASKPSLLVIAGYGPLDEELKSLAENLGIGAEVKWAGFREDIPAVMRSLDLFVLTSVYEGFGLVLIEAMAAERPIIASQVSAIPEVVTDGCTGVLVPPLDPAPLADALFRLEKDALREVFGKAGYERAINFFSLDRMVQQTLEIYDKCTK